MSEQMRYNGRSMKTCIKLSSVKLYTKVFIRENMHDSFHPCKYEKAFIHRRPPGCISRIGVPTPPLCMRVLCFKSSDSKTNFIHENMLVIFCSKKLCMQVFVKEN